MLLGVSRSSKTPLSIYLAQQGLRVANVPLDPTTEPPSQIFDVDRTRLFGLMITPEVLLDIRRKRIKKAAARPAAASSPCSRKTTPIRSTSTATWRPAAPSCAVWAASSCTLEGRAVEETAQEILRYLRAQPPLQHRHHRLAAAVPPPPAARALFPSWSKKWRKLLLRRLGGRFWPKRSRWLHQLHAGLNRSTNCALLNRENSNLL